MVAVQYTKHRRVYVEINIKLKHSPLMNKMNKNKIKKMVKGLLELQDSSIS